MACKEEGDMNKEELIEEVIDMLEEQPHEYHEFIMDLCREALKTRTIKQLKEIL